VAALTLVGSYLLYPVEADAAYAINDALWNGLMAEGQSAHAISGHHPLFHLLARGGSLALEAIGIDRPGLSAVKVLSALSAALILGMIVAAAGRRRWWLGVLLAAAIASMRGFWIEAGTGENVLTGVAFGMLALRAALDPRAGPGRVSFWIVVALLARQDNILLMPAYTFALWQRMPRPRRWRRMFIWGAVTGVLTLGLYALVWWAYASQTPFQDWLTHTSTHNPRATNGSWSSTAGVINARVIEEHLGALSVSVIGLVTFERTPNLVAGLGFLLTLLASGVFLRGKVVVRPVLVAFGLILVCRIPFYLWFEPSNFEWWLLPITTLAWAAGRMTCDDEPRLPWRRWGVAVLLLGAIVAVLTVHASHSWSLRRRTMAATMERLIEASQGTTNPIYVPISGIPMTAFRMHGIKPNYSVALSADPITELDLLIKREPSRSIVILIDRFIHNGMPINARIVDPLAVILDTFVAEPRGRILRRRGQLQAVIVPPR